VFVNPAQDESLIIELLDVKGKVDDAGSALWFLRDITNEQDIGDGGHGSRPQGLAHFLFFLN
jgi:hypothetical protein